MFVLNKKRYKFAPAFKHFGLWCNGNTTVFGAVFLGSSPSRPTSKAALFERLFCFKEKKSRFCLNRDF